MGVVVAAGMNLGENSPRMYKGRTTISERGRKRFRHGLFQAMIPILATNREFRVLHKRDIFRLTNPLSKMQSLTALFGKLLRGIFALLAKNLAYDPEKLEIKDPQLAQAA